MRENLDCSIQNMCWYTYRPESMEHIPGITPDMEFMHTIHEGQIERLKVLNIGLKPSVKSLSHVMV